MMFLRWISKDLNRGMVYGLVIGAGTVIFGIWYMGVDVCKVVGA